MVNKPTYDELKAILDASIDRIRLVDKDMMIIWANQTTYRERRVGPEKIIGRKCYEVFFGRESICPRCPAKRALKSGKMERAIMHHVRSRSACYSDNYAVPVKNESGDIINIIEITRDATKRIKAEKAFEESSKELEIKKNSLEEVNTALRVLVERRDEDKKEL